MHLHVHVCYAHNDPINPTQVIHYFMANKVGHIVHPALKRLQLDLYYVHPMITSHGTQVAPTAANVQVHVQLLATSRRTRHNSCMLEITHIVTVCNDVIDATITGCFMSYRIATNV